MGRAFEFRKGRKLKRWGKMSVSFTRIGREIAMAAKSGGGDPDTNSRLRMAIQNAKAANMPKDRVESAIIRATNKDASNYEEVIYEGYASHGVAILVETATDNPTRTVAHVRSCFNRGGGALGKSGSLEFIFDRKGIFKIDPTSLDLDDLELELIDFGLEELINEEDETLIYTNYDDFLKMQKALEDRKINVISAEKDRIPNSTVDVNDELQIDIYKLIDKMEDDDDVIAVYHNMNET
ncbi:MAG: YebC/PmpR family DNA-binding transcriptional regulator [Chlorobiota bacterium]|nr:YebC/PmpR family DNA-binding transcriptional regulator [Chlorobiota bacterium]QQS65482.1 MAG: YebC/PmpR family DNA-binding transcriptional regulator [Chlorobiota bacterium]